MKGIIFLTFTLFLLIAPVAHALDWAYVFVVWDGKVYEVHTKEVIASSEIGKKIGKVQMRAGDMSGDYFGNGSNYYDRGTPYFEIKGVSTEEKIAVLIDGEYILAEYRHDAPADPRNFLLNSWFQGGAVVLAGLGAALLYRKRIDAKLQKSP